MRGKKCGELSEKAPHPRQLAYGELSRVLWRDVQGIVAGCLGAGCLCGELSGYTYINMYMYIHLNIFKILLLLHTCLSC